MNIRVSDLQELPIRIARERSLSLGKATNATISWGALGKLLSTPAETPETSRAFLMLPKDEQNRRKAVNGWILGGPIKGNRRRKSDVVARDVITFDLDDLYPEIVEDIRQGNSPISAYEFYAHSTSKHRPRAWADARTTGEQK